jgi:prepilin-type N-terminal cleavage/methylation domain-containing protein
MLRNHAATRSKHVSRSHGFTLIEILVVVSIIAILGALALPVYQSYLAKARSSELALKYDGVRTNVQVQAKAGTISEQCSAVAAAVNAANLHSEYAAMDIAFEAVPGGFTPVMRFCASSGTQGVQGVDATREAHHLLSRSATIGKGAVIGDAVVSFSVGLLEGAVVCKVAPPASSGVAGCNLGANPKTATASGGGSSAAAVPVTSASAAISNAANPASNTVAAPVVVPPPLPKVDAQVMQFTGTGTYARPVGGALDTGGDLRAVTLDMTFIGDNSVAAASGGAGPVMFNYGSAADQHNGISLWNPRSLNVVINGQDLPVGINVIDGQTHRIAASWESATGTVNVYDNGKLIKTFTNIKTGQVIHGGGSLVVAHKDNGNNSYVPNEAFAGRIFQTSLASRVLSAAEMVRPISQTLNAGSGLLIDLVAKGSTIVDATRRHQIETGGATVITTGVEGNLVSRP